MQPCPAGVRESIVVDTSRLEDGTWELKAVVTDAAELAKVSVSGELVAHAKGPKIRIHKFKNKTGYHKRQGHRQRLTKVKVTAISTGK